MLTSIVRFTKGIKKKYKIALSGTVSRTILKTAGKGPAAIKQRLWGEELY